MTSATESGRGQRVATFLASATEIVSALGLGERLVGVSHECDYPADVAKLPRLTRARVSAPTGLGSSRAIREEVEGLVKSALALYEVDLEALRQAAPDVLITQDLCDVCAVRLDDVRRAAAEVLHKEVTIVSLRPTRLENVWEDVVRVGEVLGMGMTAQAIANGLRQRVEAVATRAKALATRPRVLAIEWIDPIMVGGLWMPELIQKAGGTPVLAKAGEPGVVLDETVDEDELVPDVVIVKPCGYGLEATLAEVAQIRERWPDARWYAADGNAYFNRSGPRLVESLEILAACVHPEAFGDLAKRHEGRFVKV